MRLKLSSAPYLYGCRIRFYIAIKCVFFSCLLLASWYTKSASEESIDAGVLLEEMRTLEKLGVWVFKEVSQELVPECRNNERFLLIIDSVLFVGRHSLADRVLHFDDGDDLGLNFDLGLNTGIETDIEARVEDYLVLCLISMLETSMQKETFVNNPNDISAKYFQLAGEISSCECALLEVNTDNIFVDIASGKGLCNYAAVGKFTINGDGEIECNIKNITYNDENNKEELQAQKVVEFDAEIDCISGTRISEEDKSESKAQYKCDMCNKTLSNSYSLRRHMRLHDSSSAYNCSLCSKFYFSTVGLKVHREKCHLIFSEYVCETCNEILTTYNNYRKHKVTHARELMPVCYYCNELFSTISNLNKHYKVCKEKYCSDNGKYAVVGKLSFKDDKMGCNIKNIICNNRESKSKSQTKKNGGFDTKTDPILGASINKKNKVKADQPRKCDVCGKILCHAQSLINHMKTHNRSDAYKCPLCCNNYVAKSTLKRHLEKSHAIFTDYVCDRCQETFTVHKDYRKHRSIHLREDIHACSLCNMIFSTKNNVSIHYKTCKVRHAKKNATLTMGNGSQISPMSGGCL
ncbi:MAG: C2H2-type zinc finger protein [Candidatus Endonucleobacter bathymodioli]|uniref:C2H2-type zinc finger protein n=1 Tax=Candidatus Endonucleibacter bathymodioli TaxID=539814 RepID=A0AA90NQP9_9GAMM|nr:C2H2-type zinc finger protein [Candidatus Endonucleobacter bathymodioli]